MDFDQLINFTRTSSATFVGSNGLIQNTPQSVNLLTWTQEFDNAAWLKVNSSITANAASAPDGTLTADTMTAAAGAATHYTRQLVSVVAATAYALSVYAKAGTHNFIQLLNAGDAQAFANFNILTGVVGSAGTKSTASITHVGNGWYRCTVVFGASATLLNDHRIYAVSSATAPYAESWTAAGTETIFLWGAQLEVGSTATTYTRNVGGLFPARFDYDPVTLAPRGILIEEQRTNLLTYSEQFNDAAWIKSGATVTANATASPDGTANADKLVETATTADHHIEQLASLTTGTTYTFSFYAKAGERNIVSVRSSAAWASDPRIRFTLTGAGTVTVDAGTPTGTITAVGNGWYRCTMTATTNSTNIGVFRLSLYNGAYSYAGDGTSGAFVWGAQLEAGAFATSYIPTVASQVTRTADQASIVAPMFAPWYNQSEGTFVVEGSYLNALSVAWVVTALSGSPASTNDYYAIVKNSSAINRQTIVAAGVSQGNIDFAGAVANTIYKMAGAYKTNDAAFSVNGSAAGVDTTVTLPTPTSLAIGNLFSQFFNGHIRRITYYPVRLLDTQLQELTA